MPPPSTGRGRGPGGPGGPGGFGRRAGGPGGGRRDGPRRDGGTRRDDAPRAGVEAAGIKDILSKSLGSSNAINIVHATIDGLRSLQRPEDVARRRGKTVEEVAPAYLLRPKVVAAHAGSTQAEPTANSRS